MGHRSRVIFDDFVTDAQAGLEEMPAQFGPRLHHCGDYESNHTGQKLTLTEIHGRKFHGGRGPSAPGSKQPVEVIPIGSRLVGYVRFSNFNRAELGGLLSALGVKPGSSLKVGAGKPLGFGRIKPSRTTINLKDSARRQAALDLLAWRVAFTGSPDYHKAGEEKLLQIHKIGGW